MKFSYRKGSDPLPPQWRHSRTMRRGQVLRFWQSLVSYQHTYQRDNRRIKVSVFS